MEVNKQALIKIKEEKEKDKTEEENKANRDKKKIKALKNEIDALQREIDKIQDKIKEKQDEIDKITTTGKSIFNLKPLFLHYCQGIEFIQPYLVQYNEVSSISWSESATDAENFFITRMAVSISD